MHSGGCVGKKCRKQVQQEMTDNMTKMKEDLRREPANTIEFLRIAQEPTYEGFEAQGKHTQQGLVKLRMVVVPGAPLLFPRLSHLVED